MSIKDTTIHKMNELGKARIPFIFILDYKGQNNIVLPLEQVNADEILFDFQGVTNKVVTKSALPPTLKAYPLESFSTKKPPAVGPSIGPIKAGMVIKLITPKS